MYLLNKYVKNVLKYKYISTQSLKDLSINTKVHLVYLSTYLSTNVLKYRHHCIVVSRLPVDWNVSGSNSAPEGIWRRLRTFTVLRHNQ